MDDAEPEELPPDNTELVNPPDNVCPVCQNEITRQPGQRGRLPKVHPECKEAYKPTRKASGATKVATSRLSKDQLKAIEESELVLMQVRKYLQKLIIITSFADPYDALVLQINAAELLENFQYLLLRFDSFRKFCLGGADGGSILGFILSIASIILPIAAHHNLIPMKKLSAILINIPMLMWRMQQRMAEDNEEELTSHLMQRVGEEAQKQREAKMRADSKDGYVSASGRQAA